MRRKSTEARPRWNMLTPISQTATMREGTGVERPRDIGVAVAPLVHPATQPFDAGACDDVGLSPFHLGSGQP